MKRAARLNLASCSWFAKKTRLSPKVTGLGCQLPKRSRDDGNHGAWRRRRKRRSRGWGCPTVMAATVSGPSLSPFKHVSQFNITHTHVAAVTVSEEYQ